MREIVCDSRDGPTRFRLNLLFLLCAALLLVPQQLSNAQAQTSSPWSGTWKLDVGRSSRPGSNFSIKLGPTGEYEMTTASFIDRFRCNGQEYPLPGSGVTITCKQPSPELMDIVIRRNGKITSRTHRELSAHDTIMTSIATAVNPPSKTTTKVYQRLTGSTGFVGAWRDQNLLEDEPQIMVTQLRDRRLRISFPGKKQVEDLPLDGSESRVQGLSPGLDVTFAAEMKGPLTIRTRKKVNDRLLEEGMITMAPDGQSLRTTFWGVASPNRKAVMVYQRLQDQ